MTLLLLLLPLLYDFTAATAATTPTSMAARTGGGQDDDGARVWRVHLPPALPALVSGVCTCLLLCIAAYNI